MSEYQEIEEQQSRKPLIEIYNEYYNKAPLGKRFLAIFIDILIITGYFIISYLISLRLLISSIPYYYTNSYSALELYFNQGNIKDNIETNWYIVFIIFVLLPPLLYFLIKDGLGQGHSLGKRIVGLQVICLKNNIPCTKSKSCLRNLILLLLSIIALIPFMGWFVELIAVIANKDGKRLGDMIAKTQVISKNP